MAKRDRGLRADKRDAFDISSPLLGVSDQRLWSPLEVVRPVVRSPVFGSPPVYYGTNRRAVLKASGPIIRTVSPAIGFASPRTIPVCIRRVRRKQVLFAKRLTGKGSRARVHRRNAFSNIRC